MALSLVETISQGGHYWKKERNDSPGHSVTIQNGTPFKIAIEGPSSNRFVSGKVLEGYLVPESGEHIGRKFKSANEVVNTIRMPSSNAFLYIHFYIEGSWVLADALRRAEEWVLDEAEELALERVCIIYKNDPDSVAAMRQAARLLAEEPTWVESARRDLVSGLSELL